MSIGVIQRMEAFQTMLESGRHGGLTLEEMRLPFLTARLVYNQTSLIIEERMPTRIQNRIILLSASIIVMAVLFILNLNRSTEQNLPPTPTQNAELPINQPLETATDNRLETQVPTATAAVEMTTAENTPDSAAVTATAEARIIATAEAGMAKATQRARAMGNIVRGLYEEGVISEPGGSYKKIEDFANSFNKSGYYEMHAIDDNARYFVLRANLLWDNAGEEISYPTAGCGFVFGYQDVSNHYRVFLNLDGNVRLHRMLEGDFTMAALDYYGQLRQPAGHANLIVAVDQDWVTVYIDNQQITRYQEENIPAGGLAYAIAAGSSIDYGTLCEFKDIELWIIE